MSHDQTWVEALKINPESLSEWSQQAPAGTPLLAWCLLEGHVRVEDYHAWACDHFGLAVLNSAFFEQQFDRQSLNSARDSWNAWCFPVGTWDDVTLLACVEPPSELPEGKFACVLADPSIMNAVWNEGAEKNADAPPPVSELDAPAGVNPHATRTFVLNLDDANLLNDHREGVDPNPVAAKTDEKTELTLSVVTSPTKVNVPKPAAKAPEPAKPSTPAAPVAEAKKAAEEDTPPPTPMPRSTRTNINISANSATEETEMTATFERLHDHYQAALLMRCSDGVAHPHKWDPQLHIVAGESKYDVNLSFPSFFRIVAKTLQPYHGYVIDSPAHREFFKNMNFEQPPACVTAIPLKNGDSLWGILVAFGGEAAQSTDALNDAQAACEKLSKVLIGPAAAKKAA